MVKKGRAYIIGAGMSGLATGKRLAETGVDVTIFEKTDGVGGASSSFSWGEFPHLDLGPHIYHTPDPKLVVEWKELFGDLLYESNFWCKNVKGENFDAYYDYPLSLETIHNFPPEMRDQVLADIANTDEVKRSKATSFYEYVAELVGPTLLEMFFIRYPQKLWGISVHEMTANWAPKRIILTKERTQFHINQWSAVGSRGSGAIMERLREQFEEAGGKISFQSEVTDVEHDGQLLTAIVINGKERISIAPHDVLISTMPIHTLAHKLGVQNNLRFRGAKLIFVAVARNTVIPGENSFLYYDHPDIVFHRVSEQKKFCPNGFPPDKTVLVAEVAYSEDDDEEWNDAELIARVLKDLERVHLIAAADAYDTRVVSLPYVYPFLSKEAEPEFARVLGQLAAFKQLYLIGTGGEFHYADLQILYTKGKDLGERLAAALSQNQEAQELIKHKAISGFNQEVRLGARIVGAGHPIFVIAEIGLNHNGNVEVAKELIDKAIEAGCSAVKFQTYQAGSRISEKIKANKYAEELIDLEESLFKMFKRCELSANDFRTLFAYARERGIEVFSTPFDIESFELLEELEAPFYKIASMDVVNLPLIEAIAKTGKSIIMSTGMSTLGQVEDAVNVIKACGNPNLVLLHCVSSYPAPPEIMNIGAIKTLKAAFRVPVGFSDHTIGLTTATVAFALGACVIERHFTLNRFMEGPDHILSSPPEEMTELVHLAGLVPQIIGTGEKTILEGEIETVNKFKKCLYAKTNIKRGETITSDKITIKGPGGGILPKYVDVVIGRTARVDIEADYPILWEAI